MGSGLPEAESSSPLLQDGRSSPRAVPVPASPSLTPRSLSSFTYGLPTFPRSLSICELAGGASEEESIAHKRMQQKLIAALCLAFLFMIVEVVGGIMAHSLAIITDAAHLLSDVSGFAVAVLAAFWAKRKSQEHFSYGYHRVEVLGALASVMTVWLVTGLLLFEAVQRIINPEPVDGKLMFIIATIGVGVNVLLLLVLGHHHHGHSCSGHDHSGGHGHSHSGGCSHSHSHDHGHGGGCGKAGAKRQLGPVLQVAAEMSRSNSRADTVGSGCCHGHHHGHGHGHNGHVHKAKTPDLEAGQIGVGVHKESHSHEHQHGSDEEAATCQGHHHHSDGHNHSHHHGCNHSHNHVHSHRGHSSDDDDIDCSGHTPILAVGNHSHQGCGAAHSHHNHSHEHNHGQQQSATVEGPAPDHHTNMNMRGAIIHVIGDFVQSIGVAIAGALIWWHQDDPRWYIADPICTFMFAALVLWTTRAILRDISDVLMERVPRGLCINTIHDDMSRVPGVESVSDLHVWSLTPGIPLLAAHVNLAPDADATEVLYALTAHCRTLGIDHSTIQLMACGTECHQC